MFKGNEIANHIAYATNTADESLLVLSDFKEPKLKIEDWERESAECEARKEQCVWDAYIEQQNRLSVINFQLHALRNM